MKFLKRLLCTHDYRILFTYEFYNINGLEREIVEECTKCAKKRKRYI